MKLVIKMNEHHYTECGLNNVYINGIVPMVDDDGDEVILIKHINQLHLVIAEAIVRHAKGMNGAELRFLRTEMGHTQAELAKLVHKDKQTIGRWERSEIEIDSAVEAVIRRIAIETLKLDVDLRMTELAVRSVPTAIVQPIEIICNDAGYTLKDAA